MICNVCDRDFPNWNRSRCAGCNTKLRRYRAKLALVNFFGGKCGRCEWTGSIAAFQFHHKDPSTKLFSISRNINKKWELVLEEAKKCEMLCANCHAIEHSNYHEKMLQAIENYNGRNLYP